MFLLACTLAVPGGARAEIIITEIMYHPEDGSAYEFIELYNAGSEVYNLSGAVFDDGIDFTFPANTSLPPQGYLVVAGDYTSFTQRYPGVSNVVSGSFSGKLSNGGERIRLVNAASATMATVTYDDEDGWPVLADGFGPSLERIGLAGDPDDPANWHSGRTDGTPGAAGPPPIEARVVRINEVQASNVSIIEDPDFSGYPDWIELHNPGDSPIDLTGCFLTDDLAEPDKGPIPPGTVIPGHGYLVLWADDITMSPAYRGYHVPFKLSKSGEHAALFGPDLRPIDILRFPPLLEDISYGRVPGTATDWHYFGDPTPAASNTTPSTPTLTVAKPPRFPVPGGFFPDRIAVSLHRVEPDGVIRYTVDGSTPRIDSPVYDETSPIALTNTTVLRARTYATNTIPSTTVTHSYFINEQVELPVVSLSIDWEYLWDDEIGIYVNGSNPTNLNYLQDWERPVHVELFEPESRASASLNMDAGIRIQGRVSPFLPQKPFTVKADDRFGAASFQHQLFPDKPIISHPSFVLRNAGAHDWWRTLLRDGFVQTVVRDQMDLDGQGYRPAAVYQNGVFWGIYNIRERLNEEYLLTNYGLEEEDVDLIKHWELESGTWTHYAALTDALETLDMETPEAYEQIDAMIDLNEHINYHIVQIYVCNRDWPGWNTILWRPRTHDGKWRWIQNDADWSYGLDLPSGYANNFLEHATEANGPPWPNPPFSTLVFRRLLENPTYRNQFISRFAAMLNTTFSPDRVHPIIDEVAGVLEADMPRHIERWGWSGIPSMWEWFFNVLVMHDFAEQRPRFAMQHLIDFFDLDGTCALAVVVDPPHHGTVLINNVVMPAGTSLNTFLQNVPINAEAVPRIGHRFVRWEGAAANQTNTSVTLDLSANATLRAVFEDVGATILPTTIDANLVLTSNESPYYITGDTVVAANATLTAMPGVEILISEAVSITVRGRVVMAGEAHAPVVLRNNPDRNARQHLYAGRHLSQPPRWGALCFTDTTSTSRLRHVVLEGGSFHPRDRMRFPAAISGYRADLELDHVRIAETPFPVFTQYGNIVLRNASLTASAGGDLVNIKYAASALTENCVLQGGGFPDADAIDYDAVSNGVIRGNTIFGFIGDNSDGIDLGEGAVNVVIQSNLIFQCQDKAISIGQASTAVIARNIIHDCGTGIALKDDGSFALIDHTTFHQNRTSVRCFEKNLARGSGQADVRNSLFSGSVDGDFEEDRAGLIGFSYCLSDSQPLSGSGNLFGSPGLRAPPDHFGPRPDSLCIDAGAPTAPPDPDGSRADIGALYYVRAEPTLIIVSPIPGAEYLANEVLQLEGTGTDDNQLAVTNLRWTAGGVQFLGDGSTVTAPPLAVGSHHIILQGVDSQQVTGQQSVAIHVYQDASTNGLPDPWEIEHWGAEALSGGATHDADHDGSSNWAEWVAGTDPTDPASAFAVELDKPSRQLTWPARSGRVYSVERKQIQDSGFTPSGNRWPPTPPTNRVPISPADDSSTTLYRVRIHR